MDVIRLPCHGRTPTVVVFPRSALAVALLGVLAGCGSEGTSSAPATGGVGGTAGVAQGATGGGAAAGGVAAGGATGGFSGSGVGGAAGAGAAMACEEDEPQSGEVCITRVQGQVRVIDGTLLPEPREVSLCGPVCYYGEATAGGSWEITPGRYLDPIDYSMLVHGRPDYASFYTQIPLSTPGPEVDLGTLYVIPLPTSGPVLATDAAAQSVETDLVRVRVAEGVEFRPEFDDFILGELGQMLRPALVPEEHQGRLVDESLGFVSLFAVHPFEAEFRTPEKEPARGHLDFANVTSLPAGTQVEILALGTYLYSDWIPPAQFQPVADGVVSDDGEWIEMQGEGVRYTTWFGIRPR